MSHPPPILSRAWLTAALAFALAACESPAPPQAEASLDQRLLRLERRVDMLEARPEVQLPYRTRGEIESHIKTLEAERAERLTRYLPQHPSIRDIDRRLRLLNTQLQMLE